MNKQAHRDKHQVLITGCSGFIGNQLVNEWTGDLTILAHYRKKPVSMPSKLNWVSKEISRDNDWSDVLGTVDVIIHTAARVHIMAEKEENPIEAFRKVNVQGTLNLANQAALAGVRRFIFISSIKVNGEMTKEGLPFTENDVNIPTDPYGLSKYEAEQELLELGKKTGMEIVIIRPPLIYGPGVKANFANMMKWMQKGIPLPLGVVNNRRSLVALDNLIDFIKLCVNHPKAANEIFLISDGEDVSTTTLLQKVAKAYGKTAKLFPVPTSLMAVIAKLVGKRAITDRLFGSLQVDNSKARNLLGWAPVISMDEQLKQIVEMEKQ